MHDTLRNLLIVITSVADSQHGDFADPSPARSDWQAAPPPMQSDLQQAYQTGMVLWHAIIDHGHGLADLIDQRRTYAAMTIARSLAETAARSWNFLEQGVPPHARVERLLNDRLHAAHENELLLRGLLPDGAQPSNVNAVSRAKEPVIQKRLDAERATRAALLDAARSYQVAPIKEPRRGAPYVGTGRPTSMDLLNRLLAHGPQANSFYRMNSAIAHAALHGQVRMMYMTQRPDGAHTSKPVPMHPDDLAPQAWPAVAASAIAAGVLFEQAGWPTDGLDAAVSKLAAAWDAPPDEDLLQAFDALV